LNFGGVALGRVDYSEKQKKDEVLYGLHQYQPLMEVRMPFSLNLRELENAARGAQDVDLDPLEKAAQKIAAFEEKAIYYGFDPGCIKGLRNSSAFEVMTYPKTVDDILGSIAQGLGQMQQASVEGPYSLVINPKRWGELASFVKGYPLKRQVADLLGGKILVCPWVDEVFLVSERGGDLTLIIGQDISIGYESTADEKINLYFLESFTFRVIEPAAVAVFK
jgi:uncharacterized linocin/CFP29 family protein